ncbi:MAG: hypothetical protein NUV83_02475 [Candidatus Wolfebacteria bacterium]|nr:hypothetical protein [Candidatus Wolfebacteria bacterium]
MKKIRLAGILILAVFLAAVTTNCGGGGSGNSQSQGGIPPGPSDALWAKFPADFSALDVVTVADGVIISGNDNTAFVVKYSFSGSQQWLVRMSASTFKNGLVVNGEKVIVATTEPVIFYTLSSVNGSVLSRDEVGWSAFFGKAIACDNSGGYVVGIPQLVASSDAIYRVGDLLSLNGIDCVVKNTRAIAVKDGYLYILGDAYTNRFMYAVALGQGPGFEFSFFNGTSARASVFDSNWIYVVAIWNGKYVVMSFPQVTADQFLWPPRFAQLPMTGTPYGIAVYDNATIMLCGDAPQSEVLMNGVTYRVYPGSGVALSPDKQYLFLANGNGIYRFEARTGNPAR